MNERIITIDLGSAYTKLAMRNSWDSPSRLLVGLAGASPDEPSLIPTVLAHDTRRGKDTWLAGLAAARLVPGPGVKVYSNWKGALMGGDADAHKLGVRFLSELKEMVREQVRDVDSVAVRICLPDLDGADVTDTLAEPLLRQAGWSTLAYRTMLFEPEANALGVAARGRNRTWCPPPIDFQPHYGRAVQMQDMLEPNFAIAFKTMKEFYGVLVTDIGAFTTDFGYLRFDSSFRTSDWGKPHRLQQSEALGIHELDLALKEAMAPESRRAVEQLSIIDWDRQKMALYGGRSISSRSQWWWKHRDRRQRGTEALCQVDR